VAALDQLRGEGWQPDRLYEHAIPASVAARVRERFREEQGTEDPDRMLRGVPDDQITVRVDVRDLVPEKRRALACHVSQIDPDGPWSGDTMADQIFESALGWETFIRSRGEGGPEGTVRALLA
jgi:LmbE family N-acetylglucosaminyl deacetylase